MSIHQWNFYRYLFAITCAELFHDQIARRLNSIQWNDCFYFWQINFKLYFLIVASRFFLSNNFLFVCRSTALICSLFWFVVGEGPADLLIISITAIRCLLSWYSIIFKRTSLLNIGCCQLAQLSHLHSIKLCTFVFWFEK